MTTIASRASWGARHRNGVGNRPVGALQKFLHHTVTAHLPATATVAQERAQMRIIETIGQQRFGAGISYTFIIFPSGRIYEGASVGRISYHSGGGRNTRGAGVCLAGNYEQFTLGTPGFNAIVALLQDGVRRGWWGDPALTSMHRDFKATSCPGRHAAARFTDINRAGRSGAAPSKPTTPERTWLEMVSKSELQTLLREEGWAYRGRDETRDAYSYLRNTHRQVAAAAGERAGLLKAIEQVAGGQDVDLGAIERAAEKGVSDALGSLEADVTLTINTDQEG